jgi:hypothetical protein
LPVLLCVTLAAALGASGAGASSEPVGKLPPGPTRSIQLKAGANVTVTLPKPTVAGRVWRVARAYDSGVVRELREGDSNGGVWVTFRGVAAGATKVVFAQTRGETARAYASRTFRFDVAAAGASCPQNLLPLTANSIGPAAAAALAADAAKNRPQVTGATLAIADTQRGAQAKTQCGSRVWERTVVVYITDRALLPSQSASQRVVFVGRTTSGYRVWQRVH